MSHDLFIGIGAQKCASTWLYDILRDHPQVVLSRSKELDFFSYHYGRGYQWYRSQFPALSSSTLAGEISPSYFVSKDAPDRVRAFDPQARILVSLRDPVERAISNHRHEVRLGSFTGSDLSFEAGLANNPMYLEQSRYGTHLRRWQQCFPEAQILILLQEDIEADPVSVAKQVYSFLDVDTEHVSSFLHVRSNESHLYRSRFVESTRKGLRNTARSLGMDGVWRAAQRAGLQRLYRQFNRRPPTLAIPPVSEPTRAYLRDLLAEEVRCVEDILGRPLPHWRLGARCAERQARCSSVLSEESPGRMLPQTATSSSIEPRSFFVPDLGGVK